MWTTKDNVYTTLSEHLEQVKSHNIYFVIGDFNAKIGTDSHLITLKLLEDAATDHRIISIQLVTSLWSSKRKTICKRLKFNRKKLQDPVTKDRFQLELTHRFPALSLEETAFDISERYESFASTGRDAAEVVLGKHKTHSLPSWVSPETTRLKIRRDEAKKMYALKVTTIQSKVERPVDSYQKDKATSLQMQREDFQLADERGHYTTTWKIIHSLFGKTTRKNIEVKLRNVKPPENGEELLEECGNSTSVLFCTTIVAWFHQNYLPKPMKTFPPVPNLVFEKKQLKQLLPWKPIKHLALIVQLLLKPSKDVMIVWLMLFIPSACKYTLTCRLLNSGWLMSLSDCRRRVICLSWLIIWKYHRLIQCNNRCAPRWCASSIPIHHLGGLSSGKGIRRWLLQGDTSKKIKKVPSKSKMIWTLLKT